MQISVLFARQDSVYKVLDGCDVWDIDRDARNWTGGNPGVFHPPCRAWGRLKHFAKPREGEKELALWSVDMVRRWGGVIEHPAVSGLWRTREIPAPGHPPDYWGGVSISVPQHWWGHPADKMTRLYVVGCQLKDFPPIPFRLGEPDYVVSSSGRKLRKGGRLRPALSAKEREKTPPDLAAWLVELARRCRPAGQTPL